MTMRHRIAISLAVAGAILLVFFLGSRRASESPRSPGPSPTRVPLPEEGPSAPAPAARPVELREPTLESPSVESDRTSALPESEVGLQKAPDAFDKWVGNIDIASKRVYEYASLLGPASDATVTAIDALSMSLGMLMPVVARSEGIYAYDDSTLIRAKVETLDSTTQVLYLSISGTSSESKADRLAQWLFASAELPLDKDR